LFRYLCQGWSSFLATSHLYDRIHRMQDAIKKPVEDPQVESVAF
jgi:hypothetical protein